MAPVNDDPKSSAEAAVQAHEWLRAHASLEMARCTRQPLRLCEALAELARCARRGALPEAAAGYLDEALTWAGVVGSVDQLADLWCERGELAADGALESAEPGTPGDPDAWLLARSCAAEAATLAGRCSDPTWEVRLLLRASDLLDRLGSRAEASALQVRAMQRLGQAEAPEAAPGRAIEMRGHPTLQ